MKTYEIIEEAKFTPKIKGYIFLFFALVFLFSIIGIPLLILWIIGVGQLISSRYYKNLKCQLTTRHLEFKKGVLFKVEKTIPLENIQDLTFVDNPLLSLFDLRVLKIETAGHSNPHGSDMKLMGIVDSAAFKQRVMEQRDLLKMGEISGKSGHNNGDKTIELLTEIRDLLKEIKK